MSTEARQDIDVVIVGTGFSGLGMAIALKQAGALRFVVLEQASEVGGTWRDNTYPGCRCDVKSHLYSFSFAPNPEWTNTFASQPEILAYLRGVADRFELRPFIRFDTRVTGASWDEATARWHVDTERGGWSARFLVLGLGGLSRPAMPSLPGLERFAGRAFHSQQWDHAWPVEGKRVGVIGTGASAIQFVPHLAKAAAHLTVFQRTPPWILPHPGRALGPGTRWLLRTLPWLQRLWRWGIYWWNELTANGFLHANSVVLRIGARGARRHLEAQVASPELRAKLTPNYAMGCKRVLLSDDYYPALTRPNVELVTSPITEVLPQGVRTADGRVHEVDGLVYGTGFHATDPLGPLTITGRDGVSLREAWRDGLAAYRGTTVAGFPNLFLLVGPNTGLGHTSMVVMIEAQVRYAMAALATATTRQLRALEPLAAAQAAWNERLQARFGGTVWATGCRSWYLDERGRNAVLWPGFTFAFERATRRFDADAYRLDA
jgi:cation diffusion facilitator CzcD-associated flavoprotein CzcO